MTYEEIHELRGLEESESFRKKAIERNTDEIWACNMPVNELFRQIGTTDIVISKAISAVINGKIAAIVSPTRAMSKGTRGRAKEAIRMITEKRSIYIDLDKIRFKSAHENRPKGIDVILFDPLIPFGEGQWSVKNLH